MHFTDRVDHAILDAVRVANEEGRDITFTDLMRMRFAARGTVQSHINELLKDGRLLGEVVQTEHGTKRLLFLPEAESSPADVVTHRMLNLLYARMRLVEKKVDAVGRAVGAGMPPEPEDGLVQTRLDVREADE